MANISPDQGSVETIAALTGGARRGACFRISRTALITAAGLRLEPRTAEYFYLPPAAPDNTFILKFAGEQRHGCPLDPDGPSHEIMRHRKLQAAAMVGAFKQPATEAAARIVQNTACRVLLSLEPKCFDVACGVVL